MGMEKKQETNSVEGLEVKRGGDETMKCWTKPELEILDVKHTMKGWKPPVHGNPGDDDCDPVVGES